MYEILNEDDDGIDDDDFEKLVKIKKDYDNSVFIFSNVCDGIFFPASDNRIKESKIEGESTAGKRKKSKKKGRRTKGKNVKKEGEEEKEEKEKEEEEEEFEDVEEKRNR